jgi:acetyltransferase-like isoleucine patch superfamily enzyme
MYPLKLIKRAIAKVVRMMRSASLNRLIDEGGGKILLPNPWMRVSIRKATGARLILRGQLLLQPWIDGEARTVIDLAEGSLLEFAGDFEIGQGVRIVLAKKAVLSFGGRHLESASGISCDSIILVNNHIHIGADFICAWGVFITDCDWHNYNGQPPQEDVAIGDKVWISHHSTILKGSVIPDGCVIAAHSLVSGGDFTANSLVAGIPATVKATNIFWHRNMITTHNVLTSTDL